MIVFSTSKQQEPQQMLRWHASHWMLPRCKASHFYIYIYTPLVFLSRIQDHRILQSGSASACR